MGREIIIKCPNCREIIEIDLESRKITKNYSERAVKEKSSDFFRRSIEEIKKSGLDREKRFEDAKRKEKGRISELKDRFEKERDKVVEEGNIDKPIRSIDLD